MVDTRSLRKSKEGVFSTARFLLFQAWRWRQQKYREGKQAAKETR